MKQYDLWTENEIKILKENAGKISFKEMTKFFTRRTASSLQKKALKLGLSSEIKFKKHSHNDDFWTNPNSINSYWAGFAAADGAILKNSRSENYTFRIELCAKDSNHLYQFKKDCDYTGPVVVYQKKKYKKEEMQDVAYVNVCSIRSWLPQLKDNFAIIRNKTLRLGPPNLPNDYLKFCYLIGMIDGDGTITYVNGHDSIKIGLYSCSRNILQWCKELIESLGIKKMVDIGCESLVRQRKNQNCSSYTAQGSRAIQLFEFLRQFPVPKLDRKWNNPNILQIISNFKNRNERNKQFFTETPPIDYNYFLNQQNNQTQHISIPANNSNNQNLILS